MSDLFYLYERLKKAYPTKSQEKTKAKSAPNVSSEVLVKEKLFDFEQIGLYTFNRRIILPSPFLFSPTEKSYLSKTAGLEVTPSQYLFMDTETTGLSGGAGTYIFLIGLGKLEGLSLILEQFFLKDFPGEVEFLSSVEKDLVSERVIISYNGKAYDIPLIKSRFALAGKELKIGGHIDLLSFTRRLWKRVLNNLSLKNIEAEVLGCPRIHDLRGWEVPQRYFSYLRFQEQEQLKDVFKHNLLDISSLVRLSNLLETSLRTATLPPKAEPQAMARLLYSLCPLNSAQMLLKAYRAGDAACGLELGLYYKACRKYPEQRTIWEELFYHHDSFQAGLELAKLLEHHYKDFKAALSVVEKLLAYAKLPIEKRDLHHRKKRLEFRLGLEGVNK